MSLDKWLDSKQRQQAIEAEARRKIVEPPKPAKPPGFLSRLLERAQKTARFLSGFLQGASRHRTSRRGRGTGCAEQVQARGVGYPGRAIEMRRFCLPLFSIFRT